MAATNSSLTKEHLDYANKVITQISNQYQQMIIGQMDLFQRLMIGMLTSGHILLEGVPGLAKTRSIQVISQTVNAQSRNA